MKHFLTALTLLLCATAAVAGEESAGEHAQKKPPAASPAGSPVEEVLRLPVVAGWTKWVASYKGAKLTAWGEYINTVDDKKCWEVAVGEILPHDKTHIWRRFCAPLDGDEVWVESKSADPDADITYMLYGRWVDECKPTEKSDGSC